MFTPIPILHGKGTKKTENYIMLTKKTSRKNTKAWLGTTSHIVPENNKMKKNWLTHSTKHLILAYLLYSSYGLGPAVKTGSIALQKVY